VRFERDLLGRVVEEIVGTDSVSSEYGPLGLRSQMRTSRGHVLDIERNAVGDVVSLRAGGGPTVGPGGDAKNETAPAWEAKLTRDQLGDEIERHLPGGVRSVWKRDKLGRPLVHEIWAGSKRLGVKSYTWEPNDRLKKIVDELRGPVQFSHDGLGNLTAAAYPDGKVDLRMPDAVGNLFRTNERSDRRYGPAGQLLVAADADGGVTRYSYDPEGNLATKLMPDGSDWSYEWNAAGMLERVVRPDGKEVTFGYDALGRRVWKKFQGKMTKWIWDGNVPVHEWVEVDPNEISVPAPGRLAEAAVAGLHQRVIDLAQRTSQGPPASTSGTANQLVTWVFEPESFAPVAKLAGGRNLAVVTDHLGTPTAMLDSAGTVAWSAEIAAYGELRDIIGDRHACPFRWPGQYEDEETGLYYNRFRYYDPESGEYVSQDPIGLAGGTNFYGYAADPTTVVDILGLAASCLPKGKKINRTVYRAEYPTRISTTWTPHPRNIAASHRYTRSGLGGVYGANSAKTALAEIEHYKPTPGRVITSKRAKLNNVLDLTDANVRKQVGVRKADLVKSRDYSRTQAIGDWAVANGYDGILAPSARNATGSNLIGFGGL
jgi:RHS repeat-associated protein